MMTMNSLFSLRKRRVGNKTSRRDKGAMGGLRFLICLLGAVALLAGTFAARAQYCGGVCTVQTMILPASMSKVLWPNFIPDPAHPPSPTRYYKTYVSTVVNSYYSMIKTQTDLTTEDTFHYNATTTSKADPATVHWCGATPVTNTICNSGHVDYTVTFYDPQNNTSCSAELGSDCTWSDQGDCLGGLANNTAEFALDATSTYTLQSSDETLTPTLHHILNVWTLDYANGDETSTGTITQEITTTPTSTTTRVELHSSSMNMGPKETKCDCTYVTTVELQDEYTVPELIARFKAEYRLHPEVEWSEGMHAATMSLTADEYCLSGQGMKYRFVLPQSDKDVNYEILFKEITYYPDGKTEPRERSEVIAGTGDVAYGGGA